MNGVEKKILCKVPQRQCRLASDEDMDRFIKTFGTIASRYVTEIGYHSY